MLVHTHSAATSPWQRNDCRNSCSTRFSGRFGAISKPREVMRFADHHPHHHLVHAARHDLSRSPHRYGKSGDWTALRTPYDYCGREKTEHNKDQHALGIRIWYESDILSGISLGGFGTVFIMSTALFPMLDPYIVIFLISGCVFS